MLAVHWFPRKSGSRLYLCVSVVPILFSSRADRQSRYDDGRVKASKNFNHRYTQMHTDRTRLNGLTGRIIGCAFTVANTLKCGFLEKVYENALAHELTKNGPLVVQQYGVTVHYDGVIVGTYTADLLVENVVLVELKAVKALDPIHGAQCLNYLVATGVEVCGLLNFGNPRLEIRRLVNGP